MPSTGNSAQSQITTGQRLGRLTVTRTGLRHGPRNRLAAEVSCDCGTVLVKPLIHLRSGEVRSCGCLRRETCGAQGRKSVTHGLSDHELYPLWTRMMDRCHDPADPRYPDYGGRGIAVCPQWHDVTTFIADIEHDLGPRPGGRRPSGRPEYTLDRTDNDRGYERGNMRWATWHDQRVNRRPVTRP